MGLLGFLKGLARPPATSTLDYPSVAFDDQGITVEMSQARRESVRWNDLLEVRVVTTSEGPAVEDIFFVIVGRDSGCIVPQSKATALLPRLQELPAFDNLTLVEAMGSAKDATFTVWRSPNRD